MFTGLAVFLIAVFLVVMLALPFCRGRLAVKLVAKLKSMLLEGPGQVLFYEQSVSQTPVRSIAWTRAWGLMAALLFTGCAVYQGNAVENHPAAVAACGLYGALAMGTSAFIVLLGLSFVSYFPRIRGSAGLRQCGLQGLWIVDPASPPVKLQQTVAAHLQKTTYVGIVDVTGFGILAKGAGTPGGFLYDAIAMATGVPVSLLLLDPEASTFDPDGPQTTVMQSVLTEMGIPALLYQKRLRATLEAVEQLNQVRPEEAKIVVRFYRERPSITALFFDKTALVSPWNPREKLSVFTQFDAETPLPDASFFEVHRRTFTRLWAHSQVARSDAPLTPAGASTVVRKKGSTIVRRNAGGAVIAR